MIVTFNALGRYGRLANQMYQIAGVIGIARRNGFDFAFPAWKNYDHLERFGSAEDIDLQKYFENPLPVYSGPELPDRPIGWGFHDTILDRSVSLSGHLQSERYFGHAIDEVRWYFRMKDEGPLTDYCAIHIRRGDYDGNYHPRMPESYYREAMGHFGSDQKFLVFSDDIPAVKTLFGDSVEYSEADYIADFRRMKRCRHFIIANSSYSAFAAVLGDAPDKQVIAPRPWFGAVAGISGEDIYSEGWQIIDWLR